MSYIDGFVVAVPTAKKDAYQKLAITSAVFFKECGATRHVEAWGDDVPDGKVTDFKRSVKAKADETIVFSWIEYPDKFARDRANEKMMNDPRMKDMNTDMPFDGQRVIVAGFTPINDSGEADKPGYIDGCVIPVPADKKAEYSEMADRQALILKEYGATRTVDAWADDVPTGKVTDYKGAVQAKPDEKIVYSWIEWPSKEVRDEGWDKAMKDPRMKAMQMPFDGKRMIYGGFAPIFDQ
jgi:uncharacterized protein YbaA (DUF1428 family)